MLRAEHASSPYPPSNPQEVGPSINPILQMGTLRLRELKALAHRPVTRIWTQVSSVPSGFNHNRSLTTWSSIMCPHPWGGAPAETDRSPGPWRPLAPALSPGLSRGARLPLQLVSEKPVKATTGEPVRGASRGEWREANAVQKAFALCSLTSLTGTGSGAGAHGVFTGCGKLLFYGWGCRQEIEALWLNKHQ